MPVGSPVLKYHVLQIETIETAERSSRAFLQGAGKSDEAGDAYAGPSALESQDNHAHPDRRRNDLTGHYLHEFYIFGPGPVIHPVTEPVGK